MDKIKISREGNYINEASTDTLAWSWFGNQDTLYHTPTGRKIYQMHWLNSDGQMDEEVTGETADEVTAFWAALKAAEMGTEEPVAETVEMNRSGICPRCHSYCYGDCEAV